MAYLDSVAQRNFVRDENNRPVYFPFAGRYGGYVILSKADYKKLLKLTKIRYAFMLTAVILVVGFLQSQWLFLMLGMAGIMAADWAFGKLSARGMVESPLAYNRKQVEKRSSKTAGSTLLIACTAGCLLFVAAGLYIVAYSPTPEAGMLVILIFGYGAYNGFKKIRLAQSAPEAKE